MFSSKMNVLLGQALPVFQYRECRHHFVSRADGSCYPYGSCSSCDLWLRSRDVRRRRGFDCAAVVRVRTESARARFTYNDRHGHDGFSDRDCLRLLPLCEAAVGRAIGINRTGGGVGAGSQVFRAADLLHPPHPGAVSTHPD